MELNKIHNTDALVFMRNLPDNAVDLVITDIPYNISQKNGGLREIDYGEWDKDIPIERVLEWTREMIRVSKNGVYIFCADEQFSHIFEECKKADMITRKYCWIKPNPNIMNGQHFWLSSGELCVMAKKRNALFTGNCEKAYKHISAPQNREHPTQKPLEIMADFIKMSSKEGETILDPFFGSGTTLFACKQLKRNYIGCEISPEFCKIAEDNLKSISNTLF
jgi:site-specific DNA-methyltransferase (adenine-specific)